MNATDRCIWIDLDNSLHVPFFRPIVLRISAAGRLSDEPKAQRVSLVPKHLQDGGCLCHGDRRRTHGVPGVQRARRHGTWRRRDARECYSFDPCGERDYLVKLDGDLSFAPDYFEACLARFQADPALGIGGGSVCQIEDGNMRVDARGDPPFHVRGATKIYRRACWEAIGPPVVAVGWDTIDEMKANRFGWSTRTFPELKIVQLKPTGAAPGRWADALTYWRKHYGRVGEWFCRQLLLVHHCVRWVARFSQRMIGQGGSDGGPGILAENAACLKWLLFGAELSDVVVGSGDHRVALPPKESEVG